MPREDEQFLADMLSAANVSLGFANGRARIELESDLMFGYALMKAVEIIGEASSQISDDTKSQYPLIRWRAIASMRNRLVHVYYDVNYDIVWDAVKIDVPILIGLLSSSPDSP